MCVITISIHCLLNTMYFVSGDVAVFEVLNLGKHTRIQDRILKNRAYF